MSLIGRQPICDAHYTIMGYDILYRDEALYHPPLTLSSYNHPFRDFLPLVFNPRVAS
jgi:hypothetical protein